MERFSETAPDWLNFVIFWGIELSDWRISKNVPSEYLTSECMYVCIYVVCIMYVSIYIRSIYVCMHDCMYLCMYVCSIYVCMYVFKMILWRLKAHLLNLFRCRRIPRN